MTEQPVAPELVERIRTMAAEMFEADVDAVSVASTPNDLEGWDSLAMLNLLVALEDEYGISLPPDDFGAATTIDGIVTIVAAHLG